MNLGQHFYELPFLSSPPVTIVVVLSSDPTGVDLFGESEHHKRYVISNSVQLSQQFPSQSRLEPPLWIGLT